MTSPTPSTGLCCPHCGSDDLAVNDSRPRNNSIWRRRVCNGCTKRFTTYEVVDGMNLIPSHRITQITQALDNADARLTYIKRLLLGEDPDGA
jgi:hypothetical protein